MAEPVWLRRWFGAIAVFLRRILIEAIKLLRVPQHVAFIMDGNRKFARKLRASSTIIGHQFGFSKFEEVLEWCMELGVPVVTVYAFSIDNFKRPRKEVDALMALCKEKLEMLCENKPPPDIALHSATVQEYGVRVRVIGHLDLLPKDVQKVALQAMSLTQDYNRATLNICVSYTSSDEITQAVLGATAALHAGEDASVDIAKIKSRLYTEGCPDIDVLIRTSGETRFSDFMLCQISDRALIHFVEAYWPEFSMWDMARILIHYQNHSAATAFSS